MIHSDLCKEKRETKNNQADTPAKQVYFMPWAGINKELKIGPVTFWPFWKMAEKKFSNELVKNYLRRYFKSYVNHQAKPVDSVTICTYNNDNLRKFINEESKIIREAIDILIFSTICPATQTAVCANNNSIGPPSADRYQLYIQNFQLEDDDIAIQAGSVICGGWKIGEIIFPQPWHMGGACASPKADLLKGFSKVFNNKFDINTRERLLRSLEWFRLAHTESDQISVLSKVVMMATAFEILLQVPNTQNKKGWIAEEFDKKCGSSEPIKETREYKKGKPLNYTKIGWWGWDFYNLRNSIVHGDHLTIERLQYVVPDNNWLPQLIVVDLVFWEYVIRELYNNGCIGQEIKECAAQWDKAFPEEPKDESEPLIASWFLGFDKIHQALGWHLELTEENNNDQ